VDKPSLVVPIVTNRINWFLEYAPYIFENLQIKDIVILGSNESEIEAKYRTKYIRFLNEDELLEGMTFEKIQQLKLSFSGKKRRAGWYFQQFLKMAYALKCNDEYYVFWDSDTIPIRKLRFFNDYEKPYLSFRNYCWYDKGFFKVHRLLSPDKQLEKKFKMSFIVEHMVVNTHIMKSLIELIESNSLTSGKYFYEKIMSSIERNDYDITGFSEQECYATFVINNYKESYELRKWNNFRFGKTIIGENPDVVHLKWISKKFATVSIEHFDNQLLIFKIINLKNLILKYNFSFIYLIFNPLIQLKYNIRLLVRNVVRRYV
jgi:hypothetical protein